MLNIQELKKLANQIRQDIIGELVEAKSGHPGGSLSIVEILVALYFGGVLNYDPKDPKNPDRDRFVVSKAHACPATYAVLARAGYFPIEELMTLRKLGSKLQGHHDRLKLPCLETSGGSLGQGLSIGVGMALAAKLNNAKWRTYVLMSDGEQEEGQIWEAAMSADHYDLDNLCAIVDVNGLQIDGWTEHVKSLQRLAERYQAFGWRAREVDGHNIEELLAAFGEARSIHNRPYVIIAHTTKGKGVSFMENVCEWHGKAPNKEEGDKALKELKSAGEKL